MVWHHHETTIKQLLLERKLKNVLEIGVESGVHTRMLLRVLEGLDGQLTSIDPKIGLLLKMRLRRQRRVRLVQAPSLEALPRLQAEGARYDCAIVDGDHNWYTVFHELEGLAPMMNPRAVILLHDVEWPYARRDMYYAPERIPQEFRRGDHRGAARSGPQGGWRQERQPVECARGRGAPQRGADRRGGLRGRPSRGGVEAAPHPLVQRPRHPRAG
jgi:predicted O-methyltransferase YrrM